MDKGYRLVTFWDTDYPVLLKKIYDPPIILYTRGSPLLAEEDAIAVVGTRTMTPYGRNTTQTIAMELSQYGLTVVSWLARGIDTAAHRATVGNGGRTIAVFGGQVWMWCILPRIANWQTKYVKRGPSLPNFRWQLVRTGGISHNVTGLFPVCVTVP